MSVMNRRVPLVLGLVPGMLRSASGVNATSLLGNVPEAANYDLVHQLDIPAGASWGNNPISYQINNATHYGRAFTQVAYYLELVSGATTNWVYVAMDLAPLMDRANRGAHHARPPIGLAPARRG